MNKKIKTPQLATPNELSNNGRQEIAKHINPIIADAFALYVKTKNFHWHMSGKHFRDYHLLFDEQADQIFNMIDILAERLRKLGQVTLHSIGEISRLQKIKDNDEIFVKAEDMIRELMNDNKDYNFRLNRAHEICSLHKDVATTSLLEVFIDETERRIWFLFETIANT